jgi:hypothetical protein
MELGFENGALRVPVVVCCDGIFPLLPEEDSAA